MLDQSTRAAILKLREQGHGIRGIARAMKLSRGAVRQILRLGTDLVPRIVRLEKATPHRDEILELYQRCNGNLVRVHEELIQLRRLLRMVDDYPLQTLLESIQSASQYGLYDLERVETMILRKLAREYFRLKPNPEDEDE